MFLEMDELKYRHAVISDLSGLHTVYFTAYLYDSLIELLTRSITRQMLNSPKVVYSGARLHA
ncbi:hypothetical protein RRG08_048272 [Elysia crispata]|uniref:Uncharacterized protein n=1 Tax=Elysia crispata TaxID=231223 RepID=A0AAE0ZUW7_9GAST|nr:hypothetical protein RRG08_048272 [Elysia crispata]